MPSTEYISSTDIAPAPSTNGHELHPSLEAAHSEEVQEIMGKMPNWIIRRGIILVGLILLCLFTGAYFFKYPDVIPARVLISFANPPVKIIARNSLPIQNLLVENNEVVKTGQILCVLENAADYADVLRIAVMTDQVDSALSLRVTIESLQLPVGLQLGELQSQYTELQQSIAAYQFFLHHNTYRAKISALQKQSAYYGELNSVLGQKENILQEQYRIQQNRFAADSSLVQDRVISRNEFNESRKRILDHEMNTKDNKSNIIQNNLQQTEYEKNISETAMQLQNEENSYEQKIRDAAKRFKGAYSEWKQRYILESPMNGQVSFFKIWKSHQFVQAGEGIMMVTPPTDNYIARGDISIVRAGKIVAGQRVLIKLPAYPFEEYGMLRGHVVSRSNVAMDSTYSIEISLDNKLITSAGKEIPQQPQLFGEAEIITENKSVLTRLFEKIYGNIRR
ncbi:multidrug resistance efflux pump [Chitinophaga skermanii]|uniref:Multidrug resistance efflux pump n=1 Tax=Chitinophaga skermanii TaxID=331697 RepID=A0A327QYC4_9BACT|nr:HlyD family efflux transporter periplasmic adaptor subunit [Chitinophaga skermanii]RAJ08612.1 multidrug resistance efflux pump [Chitinophaga skermanii]